MIAESHGLRGPDICPGLKIPILQERNTDERPDHIIPFILLASESLPILLSEVENTQNEPISTPCVSGRRVRNYTELLMEVESSVGQEPCAPDYNVRFQGT